MVPLFVTLISPVIIPLLVKVVFFGTIKPEPSVNSTVVSVGTVTSPGIVWEPMIFPELPLIRALSVTLFPKSSFPEVLIHESDAERVIFASIPFRPFGADAFMMLFCISILDGE